MGGGSAVVVVVVVVDELVVLVGRLEVGSSWLGPTSRIRLELCWASITAAAVPTAANAAMSTRTTGRRSIGTKCSGDA